MNYKERVDANTDRLIALGKQGAGPLSKLFISAYNNQLQEDTNTFLFQHNGTPPTEAEAAALQERARVSSAELAGVKLKTALQQAQSGNTNAAQNVAQLSGVTSAATNAMSAVSTGNIFGMITAIPGLLNFSMIGDFFNALIQTFTGNKDPNGPQSFGEILYDIKLRRGMQAVAQQLGTDPDRLMAEMTADPTKVPAPSAPVQSLVPPLNLTMGPPAPAAGPINAPTLTPEDQQFNQANPGTGAGPLVSAPVTPAPAPDSNRVNSPN